MDEQLLTSEVNQLRRQGITAQGHYTPQQPSTTAPTQPPTQPSPYEPEPSTPSVYTPTEPEMAPQTSVAQVVDEGSIEPFERELMQLLLLYSDRIIYVPAAMGTPDEEGAPYPPEGTRFYLRDFVRRELEVDGVEEWYSPLFGRFLSELEGLCREQGIAPIPHFTNHEDTHLRLLSTELVGESGLLEFRPDKADLPQALLDAVKSSTGGGPSEDEASEERLQEERYLGSMTLRACNSYKMALLVRYIDQLHGELKQAQRASDSERIMEILAELSELNREKQRFSNLLGDRTIVG